MMARTWIMCGSCGWFDSVNADPVFAKSYAPTIRYVDKRCGSDKFNTRLA
jgi:hypothetical protein